MLVSIHLYYSFTEKIFFKNSDSVIEKLLKLFCTKLAMSHDCSRGYDVRPLYEFCVMYFSSVDAVSAKSSVCDKNMPHISNTSNLFKHFKVNYPESWLNENKMSKSPAPPSVRQMMMRESFQIGKEYAGTYSTVRYLGLIPTYLQFSE